MTTKDTPGTLPIYLYAADSQTVQPLDFTVPSAAGIGKRTTETLYTLSQIVCVKAYSNESHHLFIMACLQENVSVGMKRVKAKVSIQDPFNPVLFTEDAERYVDVSNIVCALTWCNYRKDILELEGGDLILLLELLHHTDEVVTVAEAAETVEMTETAVRRESTPRNYRFESDFFYYVGIER